MSDELPFKVVRSGAGRFGQYLRSNGHDELLALASNLIIARGAFGAAAGMYPEDLIELRQGARIVQKSDPHGQR